VKALRAEQLRVETLHEAAKAMLGLTAENDDLSWEPAALDGPWVVNVVQFVELDEEVKAARARGT
jgi:hypothetical protein